MAMLNTMFRKLLNVNTAIFTNMRIETNKKESPVFMLKLK